MATALSDIPSTELTTILADRSKLLCIYAKLSILIIDSSIFFIALDILCACFSTIENPPSISWGYFMPARLSTILNRNSLLCWLADIIYERAVASNIKNCLSNLATIDDAIGLFS